MDLSMHSDHVVFDNVTKQYDAGMGIARAGAFVRRLKRGQIFGKLAVPDSGAKVLDNISFRIAKGEKVGIIGANGAGKSTILKLVNGVIDPTAGSVDTFGSIGGILEVSAGFLPNLSCEEN